VKADIPVYSTKASGLAYAVVCSNSSCPTRGLSYAIELVAHIVGKSRRFRNPCNIILLTHKFARRKTSSFMMSQLGSSRLSLEEECIGRYSNQRWSLGPAWPR